MHNPHGEAIAAAALKYYIKDPETKELVEYIEQASCHAYCFETAYMRHEAAFFNRNKDLDVQGFVTNIGRFVDRKEACLIARAADQFKPAMYDPDKDWLDSYQINFRTVK